jgi:hypothetical protein
MDQNLTNIRERELNVAGLIGPGTTYPSLGAYAGYLISEGLPEIENALFKTT